MTDIDTSTEAVEQAIKYLSLYSNPRLCFEIPTLIRQLAKERDEAEARVKVLEKPLRYFACNCIDTQGDEGCRHDPSLCPHNAARIALGDTND
jgi:hypothetical protein